MASGYQNIDSSYYPSGERTLYADQESIYSGPVYNPSSFGEVELKKRFGLVSRIICACVPVLGGVLATIADCSISNYLDPNDNQKNINSIVELKNKFKISAIVNSVLTVAVVTAVALVFLLNSPLCIGVIGTAAVLGSAFITYHACNLSQNKQLLEMQKGSGNAVDLIH